MTLGQRISNLCCEQKVSQRELAASAGVTEVSISRYINGTRNPKAETLKRIACKLGVTTDYLLGTGKDFSTGDTVSLYGKVVDTFGSGVLVRIEGIGGSSSWVPVSFGSARLVDKAAGTGERHEV